MKRTFFTNIVLLLLLNITVKAFWVLGIDRTVQNIVGAESYGFYFSLFSFSVLFNILLDFGITNYSNKKIAGDPGQLKNIIGNIFVIKFFFAIIYSLVALIAAHIIGYEANQISILVILMLNQFIASFVVYLRSNIAALQLYRIDSLLSVTDRFLMIIICSLLIWGGISEQPFRIEWFVYSQTAAYILTFIIALSVVLVKGRISVIRFNIKQSFAIIRGSAPFALLSLFMAVYWRIDSVMIERLLDGGAKNAGIYAQAFRLIDAAAMIPYLFSVILLPMFSNLRARRIDGVQVLKFSAILMFIPALAVTIISVLYSSPIMELLYYEHITDSAAVLSILMCSYIPVSVIYITGSYLTAEGKMKLLNIIAGSGMILNLLLNLILIPELGIRGSAISSVSVQSGMSLVYLIYIIRNTDAGISFTFLIRIVTYLLAVLITAVILYSNNAGWILTSLIIITLSLITPFLNGLLSMKEIVSFFGKDSK